MAGMNSEEVWGALEAARRVAKAARERYNHNEEFGTGGAEVVRTQSELADADLVEDVLQKLYNEAEAADA